MDGVQLLATVLSHTFDNDANVRHRAEAELATIESRPGYPSTLLHICVLPLPLPIKQAAALRFKNRIKRHWLVLDGEEDEEEGRHPLSAEDKRVIKENLYQAIVTQQQPLIRIQLLESLRSIVDLDWPNDYPSLEPSIAATLGGWQRVEPSVLHASLLCLYVLYRRFLFLMPERRDPILDHLNQHLAPAVVGILQHYNGLDGPMAHEIVHAAVKLLSRATFSHLSPNFRTLTPLVQPLYQQLLVTLQRPSPFPSAQQDQPLDQQPLWKAKKWAIRMLNRTLIRWAQPKDASKADKSLKRFAVLYQSKIEPQAFATVIELLQQYSQQRVWLSPHVLDMLYIHLSFSLKQQTFRRLMQKNLRFLIEQAIFPVLCLTAADVQLFVSDPHEYIRQDLDITGEFSDPRLAACNLIIDLVSVDETRRSNEALTLSFALVQRMLTSGGDGQQAIIEREGAMRMLGALRTVVLKQDELQPPVEQLLISAVLPALYSPHGFVRSRALWTLGRYSKMTFQNRDKLTEALARTCQLLAGDDLPVRLSAAQALTRLVRNKELLAMVRSSSSSIAAIFSSFFELLDELGNHEVITTLQMLVGKLKEDVEPYLMDLVNRLVTMFMQLSSADDSDDDAQLAASGALTTLAAVFSALADKPEAVLRAEPLLHPVIKATCVDDSEFFEQGTELVMGAIEYSRTVTPFFWSVYPHILQAYTKGHAFDMLTEIAMTADCYCRFGGEGFAQGSKVVHGRVEEGIGSALDVLVMLTCEVWKKIAAILSGKYDSEAEIHCQLAVKLMESVLAQHQGRVDHLVPLFFTMLSQPLLQLTARKDKKKHQRLILALLDGVGALCYYSPSMFLAQCEAAGLTQPLFNVWMSYVDNDAICTHFHHLRMACIALSHLSTLPLASLPSLLRQAYPELVTLLIKRLHTAIDMYEVMREEDAIQEREYQEMGGSDDDDDDYGGMLHSEADGGEEGDEGDEGQDELLEDDEHKGEMGDDSGAADGWDATEEQQLKLEQLAAQWDQEQVESADFSSSIDEVDEFVAFEESLARLKEREAEWWAKWERSVKREPKVAAALDKVLKAAEESRKRDEEGDEQNESDED